MPSQASARVSNGRSRDTDATNPSPPRAASPGDFRDHAIRLRNGRGRHCLARCCHGQGQGSNTKQLDHFLLLLRLLPLRQRIQNRRHEQDQSSSPLKPDTFSRSMRPTYRRSNSIGLSKLGSSSPTPVRLTRRLVARDRQSFFLKSCCGDYITGRGACASPRTRPCRSRPWRSAHRECRGRRGRGRRHRSKGTRHRKWWKPWP